MLGRILEKITGQQYEQYIRNHLLAAVGVDRMHIGQTLAEGRAPGEVSYYMQAGSDEGSSVFPFGSATVVQPYGSFYLEAMDSHGGWIADAPDLLKFWNAIDGLRGSAFLNSQTISLMTGRPSIPYWADTPVWYGMGFDIIPATTGYDWWHDGSLAGSRTYTLRTHDGYAWSAFFNMRMNDSTQDTNFISDLRASLWSAQGAVTTWPATDQFGNFGPLSVPAPVIDGQEGVVSAANFERGIVPGSWVSVFGANLAGQAGTWSSSNIVNGALPTTLDGVQVTFNDGTGKEGVVGSVSYVSPAQINVQVPSGLAAGAVQVQASYNGQTSYNVVAQSLNNAPGLFQYFAGTQYYAAAVFEDGTVVGDPTVTPGTRAVKPGDIISLFGTGFAPSPSGTAISTPIQLSMPVTVSFGVTQAGVQFAGLVSAGVFQVNLMVPNLTSGDYPLSVSVNDVASFGQVVLPVRP